MRVLGSDTVEVAFAATAEVGEAPLWDTRSQRLLWVDIPAGVVHVTDLATGDDRTVAIGQPVGGLAPRASGGYVLAARDGFAALDANTMSVSVLADVERAEQQTRLNDGKCDPAGLMWSGTMHTEWREDAGTLYRLNQDWSVTATISGLTLSNGLPWSPEGDEMYHTDSVARCIYVYDFDPATSTIRGLRRSIAVEHEYGLPDGITVDSEGYLWVAVWRGGMLHRYSPAGTLDGVVELPVSRPTCPAFGGHALDELYVTTARKGLTDAQLGTEVAAGSVLRLRPGVSGTAIYGYAG